MNLNGDRGSRQLWLTQRKPINNRRVSPWENLGRPSWSDAHPWKEPKVD